MLLLLPWEPGSWSVFFFFFIIENLSLPYLYFIAISMTILKFSLQGDSGKMKSKFCILLSTFLHIYCAGGVSAKFVFLHLFMSFFCENLPS